MRLIRHIIFVEVDEDVTLMINSLNGLVDTLRGHALKVISKWKNCEEIIPTNDIEASLYKTLKARGYMMDSCEEENEAKDKILHALKRASSKRKESKLTFLMTYNCNFRCTYCFEAPVFNNINGEMSDKKRVITKNMIDSAFDLIGDNLQSICLFGGEPLLPETKNALTYITSKACNVHYSIVTNGYYIVEFFDILSDMPISQITVTLDGEEKTHNERRCLPNGEPTFDKIMTGIALCLKQGFPVCIRMNIDDNNVLDSSNLKLRILSDFSNYKDLLSFDITPMFGIPYEVRNKLALDLYAAEIRRTIDEFGSKNKMLNQFTPLLNSISVGAKSQPVYSFCYAHEDGLIVDPYGMIYPCMRAVGVRNLAIGKYYPHVEYYHNSLRHRNIETILECKECIYSLLCGGGCPVAFCDHQDIFKPECFSVKNEIHNILPMFYREKENAQSIINTD